MDLYSYPAGVTLGGITLAERTVAEPQAVILNDMRHGPEIFTVWTLAELLGHGIKPVVAEALPVDALGWPYLPGVPVDTEAEAEVHRSYPNATPDLVGSAANRERLAMEIRADRTARLARCDWTQIPDAPLTAEAKASWATYRQALRDITTQPDFPQAVEWPVEPGGGL